MEVWFVELGQALISLFFQPLLYWLIILTLLTSYLRRKAERKNFSTSIYATGSEWKQTWLISLIGGIVISGLFIGVGGILSLPVLMVLSIVIILLSITGSLATLSPAYTVSVAILLFSIVDLVNLTTISEDWVRDWRDVSLTLLLFFTAVLLVLEALLSMTTKRELGFPSLIKGKRGKYVGRHSLKRVLFVPLLIPIPTGAIEAFAPWWPILPLGDASGYSLTIFPMIMGLQQVFQSMFVDKAGKLIGKWLFVMAFVTALFAIGSLYYSYLAIVGAVVAIVGRFALFLYVRFVDQENKSIFTPQPDGLLILSVIPNTPAAKMGLKVGEVIERVHQHPVTNEQEFYDALQENRTFCKLEVRTLEDELRFVQGPLYEGDHYELGLVFVKEKPRFRLYHDIPSNINEKGQ